MGRNPSVVHFENSFFDKIVKGIGFTMIIKSSSNSLANEPPHALLTLQLPPSHQIIQAHAFLKFKGMSPNRFDIEIILGRD